MNEQLPYQPFISSPSSQSRFTALQKAEILRNAEIFSRATVEELLHLTAIASEIRFKPGETIFRQGEIADALYILVEGKVDLVGTTFREVLGPFKAFGIYAVLADEPRYATAQALEDTFALKIRAQDFFDLVSHNIEIVQSLFKLLIQRFVMERER